ncbi:MAG: hypothetical protein JXJ04_26750 [Spirochaetales bacterium]|nr:hypothetical protein [Spirochaetales bacterium]
MKYFIFIIILFFLVSGCEWIDSITKPPATPLMIQDFEGEDLTPDGAEPVNIWGFVDYSYLYNGDGNEDGINETTNEITAFSITSDGADSTSRSVSIMYNIGDNDTLDYDGAAIAGYGTYSDSPMDLSDSSGISFYAKGTGILTLTVAVRTTEQMAINENNDYIFTVIITGDWAYYTVPWENLVAPDWGNNIPPIDPSQVELINLKVEEFYGVQTSGEFSIDEIATYMD